MCQGIPDPHSAQAPGLASLSPALSLPTSLHPTAPHASLRVNLDWLQSFASGASVAPRLGQAPQRAAEKPPALSSDHEAFGSSSAVWPWAAADHLSFRVLICERSTGGM